MAGIQSLMPGQAPQQLPGMMPQQSSYTPSAMTGSLKNMPMEQLKMLFMNPQPGSPPLWAVISALAEKQKEAQAIQAAMGQSAMAQNAQMQQQPPVAAQVVQAAQGGIMQGYAGGGAVAFQYGGKLGLQNPEFDEQGLPRTNEERQRIERNNQSILREQARAEAFKKQQVQAAAVRETSQEVPKQMLDFYRSTGRDRAVTLGTDLPSTDTSKLFPFGPPESPMMDIPNIQISPTRTGTGQTQQRPPAAPTPVQPTTATPADLTPEMQKVYAEREAEMRRRLTRPESLVAAEQGLAALAKSNIEAQQAEAKTYGEEIRAARDAAMAKAQRGFLDDPQALLALAGSIDTRRGQGLSSLARGAAGIMGGKEAAAEAARKEFALAQRDERAMQANIRQTQMLEAQRQVALEKNKLDEVNAINEKLAQLGMEREQFRLTRGDKAFEQVMEGKKVAATERQAKAAEISAGKPDPMTALINLVRQGTTLSPLEAYTQIRGADQSKKNFFDQISDNARANYNKWLENPRNMNATAEQRKAAFDEFLNQEIELAKRFNVPGVPTGAATTSAANDPLGLRK